MDWKCSKCEKGQNECKEHRVALSTECAKCGDTFCAECLIGMVADADATPREVVEASVDKDGPDALMKDCDECGGLVCPRCWG
jgi:hypothetical protein